MNGDTAFYRDTIAIKGDNLCKRAKIYLGFLRKGAKTKKMIAVLLYNICIGSANLFLKGYYFMGLCAYITIKVVILSLKKKLKN